MKQAFKRLKMVAMIVDMNGGTETHQKIVNLPKFAPNGLPGYNTFYTDILVEETFKFAARGSAVYMGTGAVRLNYGQLEDGRYISVTNFVID